MSELEEKFYNWLMLNYCVPIKPEKIAYDLAEIAEKYYVNCDKCLELCNENAELKKQNKLMNWAINESKDKKKTK